MNKRGLIYYNEYLAGVITQTDNGYEFRYEQEYLDSKAARPVSVTLPLRAEPYEDKVLFAFFDGLIPEGWLLTVAIDQWKLREDDRFELLLAGCRDTIGAVTVLPDGKNKDHG
ncbi:HipA N-terminal domain-containing protein [Sediminibacterium soli]|uniref:HipA N-terminal domain-containing protein n=1 Tax=Sediminibacterium soli TaxID=2698829 RepID=UPI0013797B92|nr:HipA N-terminal domain-containing protein [Sediminibacterium soli]NCI45601.1 phosphatidylinositol kinase [Sediminibacterium soli]